MVWPAIFMECSVTEDSSFGGGGVGSAGFSFSADLVSFSWGCSCAAAKKGVKVSSRVAVSAAKRITLDILYVRSGLDLMMASSPSQMALWADECTANWRFAVGG